MALPRSLLRYALLSLLAAVATIGLKMAAFAMTGSVGILADALESLVNFAAALLALAMLWIASRPADAEHAYGHHKAEYFAQAIEGVLIIVAAAGIVHTASTRLFAPQAIEAPGLGLIVATVASLINFGVARILLQAGKEHRSPTLEADGKHLMTDVWTSVGTLVGLGLVWFSGWSILDPIVALLVAANIVRTGIDLIRQAALGLLDTALPASDLAAVHGVLERYAEQGVQYHALRSRQAAAHRFVSFHLLVPDSWTVQRGHALAEEVECAICAALPNTTVFTHLEPLGDPLSWQDLSLERR